MYHQEFYTASGIALSSCSLVFGYPFTWTVKEEERVHGVTIACTTKEFYTANGIGLPAWSLLLGSPFTWTVKEKERVHCVRIACATRNSTPQGASHYHHGLDSDTCGHMISVIKPLGRQRMTSMVALRRHTRVASFGMRLVARLIHAESFTTTSFKARRWHGNIGVPVLVPGNARRHYLCMVSLYALQRFQPIQIRRRQFP